MEKNQANGMPVKALNTLNDIFNTTSPATMQYHFNLIFCEVMKANQKDGVTDDLMDACQSLAFMAEFVHQFHTGKDDTDEPKINLPKDSHHEESD